MVVDRFTTTGFSGVLPSEVSSFVKRLLIETLTAFPPKGQVI